MHCELTVTADCGGSNGARVRLWKLELQKLADETGLVIAASTSLSARRHIERILESQIDATGCSVRSR